MSKGSYLVLARKYRPQTFAEVIGQEHVTRTLQNAITRGRIHHAFLFCGGRGTGKTTTARILAKALSCVNAPTPEPCNECEACLEITRGTSVDVQEIDAASQNKVEDIRELRESIRYAPQRGKKKLYILDEVHMLSTSAFNALLKTLEEPPPHAVFVFATTDPHKLPQTILSRVQRYDFKLVPTARLTEHLADVLTRESITFDRGALHLVAREGAGSVRDSLSLLDQVLASCQGPLTEEQAAAILGVADRGLLLALGSAVVGRDPERALQIIDSAYGRGYDLAQLARALLSHLRDLVIVAVVKDPTPLLEVSAGELDEISRQAREARGATELLFDRMLRIAEDTARAAQPRYVLEVGLVELCQVQPLQPFDVLVHRLESLEGRLESGGAGHGPGGRGGSYSASTPGGGSGGGPGRGGLGAAAPPSITMTQGAPLAAPPAAPRMYGQTAAEPPRASAPAAPASYASPASAASPALAMAPPAPAPRESDAAAVHTAPPLAPRSVDNRGAEAALATDNRGAEAALATEPRGSAVPARDIPPAPVAAVAAPAAAPSDARRHDFHALAEALMKRSPTLAAPLSVGRPVVFDDERLALAFDRRDRFQADQVRDKLPQLRALVREVLGFEPRIEVEVIDDPNSAARAQAESLVEAEQRKASEDRAQRRREALEHPARKLISEVFGDGVTFSEPEME